MCRDGKIGFNHLCRLENKSNPGIYLSIWKYLSTCVRFRCNYLYKYCGIHIDHYCHKCFVICTFIFKSKGNVCKCLLRYVYFLYFFFVCFVIVFIVLCIDYFDDTIPKNCSVFSFVFLFLMLSFFSSCILRNMGSIIQHNGF